MPHSSSPILTVTPLNEIWNIKAEFFYCCHSTKEEFIVYVTQSYLLDCIKFDFYKSNGTLVYSKRFTYEGMNGYEYNNIDIKVSPNGKYIYMKLNSSKYRHKWARKSLTSAIYSLILNFESGLKYWGSLK